MKKTFSVNIGSMAFTIDDDAYMVMKGYLEDIEERLDDDARKEVMEDVELRVADILQSNLTVPGQVVTMSMVRQVIAIIGRADCFGDRRPGAVPPPPPSGESRRSISRLYRSRDHRAIAGLCSGVAEYMGWDTTAVRVVTLLLVLFGGLSLWVYIILWIVIPQEPENFNDNLNNDRYERR